MKISDLITFLRQKEQELGDVDLFSEYNSGGSTSAVPISRPRLGPRDIWKHHPDNGKVFLDLH